MVTTYIPLDQREAVCPACGASIKAPPSSRSRRVQCPKCREVIVLESRVGKGAAATAPRPAEENQAAEDRGRIAALEGKVAALEATMEAALARANVARAAENPAGTPVKLQWVASIQGRGPDFSAMQGHALVHNLGAVAAQEITIRIPLGDAVASEQAAWFKAVFHRAGWTVRGPVEIAPEDAGRVLSLAVPELPVAEDAAKTYIALRAAGFEPVPVLDSKPGTGTGACALFLTIPSAKVA